MPCCMVLAWLGLVRFESVACDWYALIILSAWTIHCGAASMAPWPAPCHEFSGEWLLYCWDMP